MKTLLASFLLFAASAFGAALPGSYALVTSTLTVTSTTEAAPTTLRNGDKQTVATWATRKVTNAVIVAEAQRQGLLTAGDISGWKVYAIFDASALSGFVISNGLKTLWIDSVISVSRADVSGFATKGKWVRTTTGDLVSGGTTYLDGFLLRVSLDGVTYVSTCAPQITDKVVIFWPLSGPVWRPAAFNIAVVGLPDMEDSEAGVMRGTLNIAAARAEWNLGLGLLGFPGFD
jgi:hypothetical protein